MDALQFDYYYGIEAEQFSFYRVPRLLVKDERFKKLSSDAKLLYGLMLDRMGLSMKNGWLDDENRAYIIYTIENVTEDLGCGKDKAVKVLAELDSNKGIGLIEKKRIGLGKPDIIYVKNFSTMSESDRAGVSKSVVDKKEPANALNITECGKTEFKDAENQNSRIRKNRIQEVGESEFKNTENQNSGSRESRIQEVGNTDPNYTNTNYTDMSYIESNHINRSDVGGNASNDGYDTMDETHAYIELLKQNLDYESHKTYDDYHDFRDFEEIFELICEVVCVKRQTIKVNGEDYPYEIVKSRFLKLNSSHIDYVRGCLKETTTKVTNIRSYLITALYNAPATMGNYFNQLVQHDMYGGGWHEKGIV